MSDRPARVNDLVGWIERVHVESELARSKMQTALTLLSDLTSSNYEDTAVAAYARFITALEQSEKQADSLRGTINPMKSCAVPVFDQWTRDLEQFSSPTMRQRSQERMKRTEEQYNIVVAAVEPAQETYDMFNKHLRDHALFLGHDLNPASVKMLDNDVKQLRSLARELDGRFAYCLKASREYVNSYSLPVGVTAQPTPNGEGKSDR